MCKDHGNEVILKTLCSKMHFEVVFTCPEIWKRPKIWIDKDHGANAAILKYVCGASLIADIEKNAELKINNILQPTNVAPAV